MVHYPGVLRARYEQEVIADKRRAEEAAANANAAQTLDELERDGWIEKG